MYIYVYPPAAQSGPVSKPVRSGVPVQTPSHHPPPTHVTTLHPVVGGKGHYANPVRFFWRR